MSTETDAVRMKKEMTPTAKYLNIAVQLILLILVAYIVTRTVNQFGVVLFTWHPVLISIGVRRPHLGSIAFRLINTFFPHSISF